MMSTLFSKDEFVERIEFIRSKLSNVLLMYPGSRPGSPEAARSPTATPVIGKDRVEPTAAPAAAPATLTNVSVNRHNRRGGRPETTGNLRQPVSSQQ